MSSYRERLERFYGFYAPDKQASVDAALEAYKGREDQMFRALERKYGPESAVTGSTVSGGSGVEGEHETQSVVPTLNFSPFRQRLVRFYRKWQPDKLNTVDQVLTAYVGREPLLFQALVKKYGPEPEADEGAAEHPTKDNLAETVGDLNLSTAELKDAEVKTPKSPTGPYKQALLSVGYASSDFQSLFEAYGKGKEKYAGAIALLMKVIGDEALFDVTSEKLPFPADRYPKAKDEWDELAFDHILAYRQIFFAAYASYVAARDEEGRERSAIVEELTQARRRDAYDCLVRRQALLLIEPIEEERRSIITDDERLRFNGLCAWFRQKRTEYLMTEEEDEEILQLASRWDRFKESAAGMVEASQKLHTVRSKSASKMAEWQRLATNSSPDPERPWRVRRVASDRAVKPAQHEQPWRPNGVATRSASQVLTAQDPDHRTGSVLSRTTSHVSSRHAVLKKLQDKPLESVRAKNIVQKGLFSQLKYGGQSKRLALGATW